jgi:hypothetical protein
MNKLLSIEQFARKIGMHPGTVRRWMVERRYGAGEGFQKVGRLWRIDFGKFVRATNEATARDHDFQPAASA